MAIHKLQTTFWVSLAASKPTLATGRPGKHRIEPADRFHGIIPASIRRDRAQRSRRTHRALSENFSPLRAPIFLLQEPNLEFF